MPIKDIDTLHAELLVSVNLKMLAEGLVIVKFLPPLEPLSPFSSVIAVLLPCLVAMKKVLWVRTKAFDMRVLVTYK